MSPPVDGAAARPAAPSRHGGHGAAVPADAMLGVAASRRFFPELEALRGLAVLLVVAFHADGMVTFLVRSLPASALTSFVRSGSTGVDLFFVLSGFLLALPFIDAAGGGRPVSLRTYFARRALRIVPLYYAAVLAGVAVNASQLADLRLALPYLFFLNGLSGTVTPLLPFSAVWWSLATEAQFYLLLPLLPLALRSRRGRLVGALALLVYGAAYAATAAGVLRMDTIPRQFVFLLSVFGRGPVFLCGIAAAWLVARHGDRLRDRLAAAPWVRAGGADLALAATLVAMAFFLRAQIEHTRAAAGLSAAALPWHAVAGVFWAAILLCLILAPLRTKHILCNAALARLGVLSYSIYVLHVPVLKWGIGTARRFAPELWGWTPQMTLLVALLAVVGYAASSLTYAWIERPSLARKARFE